MILQFLSKVTTVGMREVLMSPIFVIDLSEDGKFLGLEVIGASERLPLNSKQLSKVEDVEITVQEEEDNMMVTVVMKLGNEKTSLNLPVTGGMTGKVT